MDKKIERRIAVIKDAIKQVKDSKYEVLRQHGYVSINQNLSGDSDSQAKPLISGNKLEQGGCTVCAKGALLVSHVRKENVLTVSELENCNEDTSKELRNLFGARNLDIIEMYFEGEDGFLGDLVYDDTNRLLLILENMLKNEGKFVPDNITIKEINKYV